MKTFHRLTAPGAQEHVSLKRAGPTAPSAPTGEGGYLADRGGRRTAVRSRVPPSGSRDGPIDRSRETLTLLVPTRTSSDASGSE
ncbi:hypothetical protein EYF80_035941 [Liparis tanakae]|uniref:Uncharacterized protein n=1 Tax=Liparis tanakae TaxID=230148 RepID=A0A4Z2GKY6_9TELE|nr:hypothetical protein EYF80_035941 [Liparis tanakae]